MRHKNIIHLVLALFFISSHWRLMFTEQNSKQCNEVYRRSSYNAKCIWSVRTAIKSGVNVLFVYCTGVQLSLTIILKNILLF